MYISEIIARWSQVIPRSSVLANKHYQNMYAVRFFIRFVQVVYSNLYQQYSMHLNWEL